MEDLAKDNDLRRCDVCGGLEDAARRHMRCGLGSV
jgi:hypothetical protein